ncbi:unnamed protein product [Adineta steineri]|uniref:Uncharacterized protein n=1 Tax=Adineta steineri TaxID=433720 RepID=A0A813SQD4_9BILA|nr:unnamed protein product [Adineta steineri]CAF0815382.1 unnamed protein product [Adineta steineri]
MKKIILTALAATITGIILGVAVGVPMVVKMNQNEIATNSAPLFVTATLINTTSSTTVFMVTNVSSSSTTGKIYLILI